METGDVRKFQVGQQVRVIATGLCGVVTKLGINMQSLVYVRYPDTYFDNIFTDDKLEVADKEELHD
jgi:hypothetical protein